MAIQDISKGTTANDGTGTKLRTAADYINQNFAYVLSLFDNYVTIPSLASTLLNYVTNSALATALSLKLNVSDYVQHHKGVYTTLGALQTAHPTGIAGDTAQVDAGSGLAPYLYLWDMQDGWILSQGDGSGAVNTDQLPEGNTNLYFTNNRVVSALSSFTTPVISAGVLTLDCSGVNNFVVAWNQNITSLDLSNVPSGVMCSFTLTLTQDATGGRTIAIPASFKIMNDAMVLNTLATKESIVTASTVNSGTTWTCHWSTEI